MSIIGNPKNYINLILLLLFFGLSHNLCAQEKDSAVILKRFGGAVTISTKGNLKK